MKKWILVIGVTMALSVAWIGIAQRRDKAAHVGNVFYDLEAFDRLCSRDGGFTIAVVKPSSAGRPFACVSPLINEPGERCLEWGGIWDLATHTCSNYHGEPFGLFDGPPADVQHGR